MAPSSTENPPGSNRNVGTRYLHIHKGLEGFDENLEILFSFFEELQLSSGDIANPQLDLLTFASSAHFFGVLTESVVPPKSKDQAPAQNLERNLPNTLPDIDMENMSAEDIDATFAAFAHSTPEGNVQTFKRGGVFVGPEGAERFASFGVPVAPLNARKSPPPVTPKAESYEDLELALAAYDNATPEDARKALEEGGIWVGPDTNQRWVSFGVGPKNTLAELQGQGQVTQPNNKYIYEDIGEASPHGQANAVASSSSNPAKLGYVTPPPSSSAFLQALKANDIPLNMTSDFDALREKRKDTSVFSEEEFSAHTEDDGDMYEDMELDHWNAGPSSKRFGASTGVNAGAPTSGTDLLNAPGGFAPRRYRTLGDRNSALFSKPAFQHIGRGSGTFGGSNPAFNSNPMTQIPYDNPTLRTYRQKLYARRGKTARKQTMVGLVYLVNSQDGNDLLRSGELNVGVIVHEKYRRRGYALEAVQEALKYAFEDENCIRVQAVVIDGPNKHAALNVFMKSGFGHEGTRRRAFRSPYTMEFKDITYLGILATDWVLRKAAITGGLGGSVSSTTGAPISRFSVAPTTLWEEMFARHQREREELLKWEEKNERGLQRFPSNETIREAYYKTETENNGDGSAAETTDSESAYAPARSRVNSVSGGDNGSVSALAVSPLSKKGNINNKGKLFTRSALSELFRKLERGKTTVGQTSDSESDRGDAVVRPDANVEINSWIAATNASSASAAPSPGNVVTNLQAMRASSPGSSSESGFSELSAPSDPDSASDAGSELSFSSLPSEASSLESNWDVVDGIDYNSDVHTRSNF